MDQQTYTEYSRQQSDPTRYFSAPGRRHWSPEECQLLQDLLNDDCTQLELLSALPHRNWGAIKTKIKRLFDKRKVPANSAGVRGQETLAMFNARTDLSRAETSRELAHTGLDEETKQYHPFDLPTMWFRTSPGIE